MEKPECRYLVDGRVGNCEIKKDGLIGRIRCMYKLRGESCDRCNSYQRD